ncbi:MAG: SDR family NAD(P)-dependent oxidoreductase [Pseudomonadota bacterium]
MLSIIAKDFGPWVIVTGASSGIGREFCAQLAELGLDVVLVARSEAKLTEIADEIRSRRQIQTRVLALDLSEPDFLPTLLDGTADLDIGLVVSNAGADHMGALLTIPLDDLRTVLRLNTVSHLDIAHGFGSRFLEKRKSAGLLFVSSTASLQTTPLLANYAGAKAYIFNLGGALHYELKGTGITSSVLVPGPTRTPGLTDRTDVDFGKVPMPPMEVSAVVNEGLMGLARNKPIIIAGRMNRFMNWMGRRLLTRGFTAKMWGMLMGRAAPERLKVKRA